MPAKGSLRPKLILPHEQYALSELDKARFADEEAMGIVPPHDPVLARKAAAIDPEIIDTEFIQEICTRLMEISSGQQRRDHKGDTKRTLVGLAAPQIGESLRIVVIDTKMKASRKGKGKLECFINPEIIWRSAEAEESHEGCFSAGPVWGLVKRPVAVKIRAYTTDGKQIERILRVLPPG